MVVWYGRHGGRHVRFLKPLNINFSFCSFVLRDTFKLPEFLLIQTQNKVSRKAHFLLIAIQ